MQELLYRCGSENIGRIIFSDDKLFCSEQIYIVENDVVDLATYDDIPENFWTLKRFQNKNSVMIWAVMSVSHSRKMALEINDKKLKISADQCKQETLSTHLLPYADI